MKKKIREVKLLPKVSCVPKEPLSSIGIIYINIYYIEIFFVYKYFYKCYT